MGRTRSISVIESELSKAEASLKKAQRKVEDLSELVLKLQRQKQEYEAKRIMEAYKKSIIYEYVTGKKEVPAV